MQEDEDKTGDANIQGKKTNLKAYPRKKKWRRRRRRMKPGNRSDPRHSDLEKRIKNITFFSQTIRGESTENFFILFLFPTTATLGSPPASTFFSLIRRKEISLSPSSAVPFPNFPVKNILSQQWEGKGRRGKGRGASSRSPHQPAVENGGVGLGGPWMDIFVCASYQKFIAR